MRTSLLNRLALAAWLVTVSILSGWASAGGGGPHPLAALRASEVCISEGVSVRTTDHVPLIVLQSLVEEAGAAGIEQRETPNFRLGDCLVHTNLVVEYPSRNADVPYTIRLQLVRDRSPEVLMGPVDVLWETVARGEVATTSDMETVVGPVLRTLYARLVTAWQLSHP
ncbi:hypothetical protein [Deinococcus apachensis]|uniref:hypothetical protein n=1 Tax=Deinococcus apachensis TaxID=309886 RepID=UPI00036A4A2C|nr:hypothetical protein [Deinococcus apachensis]